jgi:hypothetical protein
VRARAPGGQRPATQPFTDTFIHIVVAVSPEKAHVILHRGDRVRADGSLIETVAAFYGFTRTDEGWKIFAISDLVDATTEPP